MNRIRTTAAAAVLMLAASPSPSAGGDDRLGQWPQWRGPLMTGTAPLADPPLEWGQEKNVRWKTAIPGKGHSTPVVWGERVFLTTAVPFGERLEPLHTQAPGAHDNIAVTQRHRFIVIAVDRRDGKVLWQNAVREALPHDGGGHYSASLASNSPATDGQRVYAFFGSHGLYCLTLGGELVWSRDLGKMYPKHGHGEGASPALWGDVLVVNWDHDRQSFVIALNKHTGEQLWKVDRDEETSWASPIIVEQEGKPQAIISGTNRIRGYDLATGKVLWECDGLSSNIVASPVAAGGMAFAGSSYEKQAMVAIRLDGAKGDVSDTDRIAWRRQRATPYVPSPLLYEDGLYFLTHYQAILTRVDAMSGEDAPGAMRLSGIGNVYASPVAAAGRIYITDLDGTTLVLSAGKIPRSLALNKLEESVAASAAVAGRKIFFRGAKHLYCIARE